MGKIAVVSVLDKELAPCQEMLEKDLNWSPSEEQEGLYFNEASGNDVLLRVVGVGKVNAAAHTAEILLTFAPELVINIGYAGGMAADAHAGDIVIGIDYKQVDFTSLVLSEPGLIPKAPPYVIPEAFIKLAEDNSRRLGYPCHTGRVATGDFFLNDSKRKSKRLSSYSRSDLHR